MKVFVDLDSTLNRLQDKWLPAIYHHLGEMITIDQVTTWDRLKAASYHTLLQEPGFFRDLGIESGAQQALQMAIADGYQVFILSATEKWDYADKRDWVEELFPFIPRRNFIGAACKGELAGPTRLLIDDGPHNLEAWERAGGIAVAYSQPWNQSWKGLRMNSWFELAHILGRQANAS